MGARLKFGGEAVFQKTGVGTRLLRYHRTAPGTINSIPGACRLFSCGVIFTHAPVSLALLSLRTNGGLLVV